MLTGEIWAQHLSDFYKSNLGVQGMTLGSESILYMQLGKLLGPVFVDDLSKTATVNCCSFWYPSLKFLTNKLSKSNGHRLLRANKNKKIWHLINFIYLSVKVWIFNTPVNNSFHRFQWQCLAGVSIVRGSVFHCAGSPKTYERYITALLNFAFN